MRSWLKQHRSNADSRGNPFARDTQPRKLRVLLHLSDDARSSLAGEMVAGLDGCGVLDVWSTRPDAARRVCVRWTDQQAGKGSVFTLEAAESGADCGDAVLDEFYGPGLPQGRRVRSETFLHDFVARERTTWLGWMPDLAEGPLDELDEWLALHWFASTEGIDLVATDSSFILSLRPRGFGRGVVSLPEAAACVGLYRRSRGDFAYRSDRGRFTATAGRSGFYQGVARELMPNCRRLLERVPRRKGLADDGPALLLKNLLARVARALQARDQVHWALLGDDGFWGMWSDDRYEGLDEALSGVDGVLFSLAGAFDVAARLANEAYGLGITGAAISWRRYRGDGFGLRLLARAPEVAALLASWRGAGEVLDVIAELRNTVHYTSLEPVHVRNQDDRDEQLMFAVPKASGRRVRDILERLDGVVEFGGLFLLPDGILVLEPQTFVERILPLAVVRLDELVGSLDATAIEQQPTQGALEPRARADSWPEPDAAAHLRLLAGLEETSS
ncbi:MAG: hypothetical protein HY905_15825 [Deltaproteobacteria bacterium]|nr:hypothetical protein [Deltaproteobacteria bacterium]